MSSIPPLLLEKTHRCIIDQTQKTWYVQNGYVYDVHGNVLGKANDLKSFSPKWYFFCHFNCGNTYTKREHLEKHIYEDHRDLCIHRVPLPAGMAEGFYQPTEKSIIKASKELADEIQAEEPPFIAKEVVLPRIETRRKPKALAASVDDKRV